MPQAVAGTRAVWESDENGLVPVLGFVFLPWTTFLYGLIQGSGGSVGPLGVIAIIIGLMVDLTTLLGAFGQRRARADAY